MLDVVAPLDQKLLALRWARLLTQEQLACRAGISVIALRNLERGRAERPRAGTVRALARTLGVSPLDLADPTLSTAQVLRRAERSEAGRGADPESPEEPGEAGE